MDERAPLLQFPGFGTSPAPGSRPAPGSVSVEDPHRQFCELVGVRPVDHPPDETHRPRPQSLYGRALQRRRAQNVTYMFTATLVNSLLLTQVVLGAALTGLGASDSSRVLITVFGALNTIIAGVVAFLKSRGQPMRARMFRDDLSRVVDEIENSAVMWYGISGAHHGYGAIDTDEQVTVRGEVARLTRLYDKAVKTNTMNDPDMYAAGAGFDQYSAGLRKNPAQAQPGPNFVATVIPQEPASSPLPPPPAAAAVPVPSADPDASPASKAPEPAKPKQDGNASGSNSPRPEDSSPESASESKEKEGKDEGKGKEVALAQVSSPPPTPAPMADPDASPATFGHLPKREESSKTLVD